jgi:hypothetical protein
MRSSRRARIVCVMKRVIVSMTLSLILATAVPNYEIVSTAYSADSVVVAVEELDSLIAGVDSLLYERRLLQIDLTEAQRMARADSLMFEERLNIYREHERSWLSKALSHPAIWFMIGAYAGLQAAR